MPTHWTARSKIDDPATWKTYTGRVPARSRW